MPAHLEAATSGEQQGGLSLKAPVSHCWSTGKLIQKLAFCNSERACPRHIVQVSSAPTFALMKASFLAASRTSELFMAGFGSRGPIGSRSCGEGKDGRVPPRSQNCSASVTQAPMHESSLQPLNPRELQCVCPTAELVFLLWAPHLPATPGLRKSCARIEATEVLHMRAQGLVR